ncbi:MAG: hypothetical protein U5N86_12030 [Planctomycetota bacterium]|nr:hypothetical protein [Planctomycetota bacterium]
MFYEIIAQAAAYCFNSDSDVFKEMKRTFNGLIAGDEAGEDCARLGELYFAFEVAADQ